MKAAPTSPRRGWLLLKWLLGAALGALLAYFLLRQVDPALILEPLRQVPPLLWALAGAGWVLSFFFRAARLQQEWRPLRQVPLLQALRSWPRQVVEAQVHVAQLPPGGQAVGIGRLAQPHLRTQREQLAHRLHAGRGDGEPGEADRRGVRAIVGGKRQSKVSELLPWNPTATV